MAWEVTELETPSDDASSYAMCVNSDGSVIGGGSTDFSTEAKGLIWQGGTFTNVGSLAAGDFVIVRGISGDGSIAVGEIDQVDLTSDAFFWAVGDTSPTPLPYLGTGEIAAAQAISNDGSVIVGQSSAIAGTGSPSHPVSWTSGGPAFDLGIYSTNTDGIALAVDADGAHIAGGSSDAGVLPWQWTSGGGAVGVATPGGFESGNVFAIDAAGTVVGGQYFGTPPLQGGFISESGTGTDVTPAGYNVAVVLGLSPDGLTSVGRAQATIGSDNQPFIWTLADGFTFLPLLAGHTQGSATAISADGTTIVGRSGPNGGDSAVYWRQASVGITVPLRHLRTFAVSPLPYLLPGGPSSSPTYSWMAATTDIPASASATLNDPSLPLELNGLQLDFLQQSQFVQANYGAAVNSANARTVSPPTAAASWNGQMATSDVFWDSGNVYAFTASVLYPSTVVPTALSSTADVLGFSSGTSAEYSPQPVLWEDTQYLILYARPQPDAEPRMLLGKADGTISWKTIWSGGNASGSANAPLWYEDQGGGNNFVLLGGDGSTVRPTLGLIPSAALGAETYSALTLDTPMYDAAFLDIAAASGPNTPLGQTVPGGWLLPTDDGYFIFLANDASFYDIYQFTSADPFGQQILSNAAGRFKTTNSRMFLTDVLVPFLIVPPATAIANAPDVTVLSYPPVIPASGGGGDLCGWRGLSGINWHGMALVGDKFSNVVGLSDFSIFREYGNGMQWLVTSPPVHKDRKRIFMPRFEIEVEAGLGLPDSPATAPQMTLEISKDGGVTWQPLIKARSMGALGEYLKRLRWLQLGSARQWVFRLRYSDSARPALIGAYMDDIVGLG